jgi:hypothetical protein
MSLRTVSCSRARRESLDCGLIAFAVSLRGVSDLQPRTVGGDRDIQGAADPEPRVSRLAAWRPGGLLLTCRPASGAGATPTLPGGIPGLVLR